MAGTAARCEEVGEILVEFDSHVSPARRGNGYDWGLCFDSQNLDGIGKICSSETVWLEIKRKDQFI